MNASFLTLIINKTVEYRDVINLIFIHKSIIPNIIQVLTQHFSYKFELTKRNLQLNIFSFCSLSNLFKSWTKFTAGRRIKCIFDKADLFKDQLPPTVIQRTNFFNYFRTQKRQLHYEYLKGILHKPVSTLFSSSRLCNQVR